jgi:hypothetical protein
VSKLGSRRVESPGGAAKVKRLSGVAGRGRKSIADAARFV